MGLFGRSKDDGNSKDTSGSSPKGFTAEQKAGHQGLNDRLTCSRLESRDKKAPGSF
ncbi:hypothetical protein ACFQ7F_41865 [Streptomyces sp. NPDC056486]|uniref:hypothetical protein n=1 Tax=Streptomyces sp. NPDC056486 TaxID=3345835 RepID=UPI0036C4698E